MSMERLSHQIDAYVAWKRELMREITRYRGWLERSRLNSPAVEAKLERALRQLRADHITLAFVGKFGAILQSIPVPVMGGILCLLFGTIASVGMNTLIRHKVDLSEARNLVIVSVTLVFGIGGVLIGSGTGPDDIGLKGIALCAIVAIVLNLLLPGNDGWQNKALDEQHKDSH